MYTFLLIIHVLNCFLLVAVVLLQSGKGADMGAAFGGSGQTVFGSRGAATFLSKMTIGAAVLFFLTSLGLSILTRTRLTSSSVIDPPASTSAETTPASVTTPASTPSETTTPSASSGTLPGTPASMTTTTDAVPAGTEAPTTPPAGATP